MRNILIILFSLTFGIASSWQGINTTTASKSKIEVASSNVETTNIQFNIDGFHLIPVDTPEGEMYLARLEDGASLLEAGSPDMNKYARSIVIPDDKQMAIKVLSFEFVDYENILIAPSKGNLSRLIDPSDVEYEFGPVYQQDEFFPGNLAGLEDPYILRDVRGQSIVFYPIQYNSVQKVLRVYNNIEVEVYAAGPGQINVFNRTSNEPVYSKEFLNIYNNHFINYSNDTRFDYLVDHGNMLVISYSSFMETVQPLVDWKNRKGIPTEMVDISDIGSSSSEVQNYVANYYNENGLTFLLLVGDIAQMPSPSVSGSSSDMSYGCISGSDFYAEVIVGRFSGSTPTQIATQVERSIEYERYPQAGAEWYDNALGIASNQGPGFGGYTDDQFNDFMWDTVLSDFTYDSYEGIYDDVGTDAQGINAINDGISLINYTGHGSISSWGNGASLSSSQVNSLANDNRLPFIITTGCNVGEFQSTDECFAEAWLRATNGGEPTGAISHFGSTISQSWEPPMHGQYGMMLVLTESYDENLTRTMGGITTNGCMYMNDAQGSSGINETKYWTYFGDPTVPIRSAPSTNMSVVHDDVIIIGSSEFLVSTGFEGDLVALSRDGELLASGYTNGFGNVNLELGDAATIPGELDLVATGFNNTPYETTVMVLSECDEGYDECGVCGGDNTSANCDGVNWNATQCTLMDCAGVCGGDADVLTVYQDADGDGLGDPMGSSVLICSTDGIPAGYVANFADIYDDCACGANDSSCKDECNVCNGPNYIASCADGSCSGMDCAGVCGGSAVYQWYYKDCDQDNLGSEVIGEFCSLQDYSTSIPNPELSSDNYCYYCSDNPTQLFYSNVNLTSCTDTSENEWVTIEAGIVANEDDIDDSCHCSSNDSTCYDECGVCNGGAIYLHECEVADNLSLTLNLEIFPSGVFSLFDWENGEIKLVELTILNSGDNTINYYLYYYGYLNGEKVVDGLTKNTFIESGNSTIMSNTNFDPYFILEYYEDWSFIYNLQNLGYLSSGNYIVGVAAYDLETEVLLANAYKGHILGCTDPEAPNYEQSSTMDDGSCVIFGCMDVTACNYNPDAIENDGNCEYGQEDINGEICCQRDIDECGICEGDNSSCSGCMDDFALNTDEDAIVPDASCIYPEYGCNDPEATNYDGVEYIYDGSCIYPPFISIYFGEIDMENQTLEVRYNSPMPFYFNFSVTGADFSGWSVDGLIIGWEVEGTYQLIHTVSFGYSSGLFCLENVVIDVVGFGAVNPNIGGCAAVIGAGGGEVQSGTVSAGVNIPGGALSSSETISIGEVTEELPEAVKNATGFEVTEIAAFTPYSLKFSVPVEISVSTSLGRSQTFNDEYLCMLENSGDTSWEIVEGANCSNGSCTAQITSFGIYAVCTLVPDCNGDTGGSAYLDVCGECVGGNTGLGTGYTIDDCGLCGGPGMSGWYLDLDGDGMGDSLADPVMFCANSVADGYVSNNLDTQPACATNNVDECGICGGDNSLCGSECTDVYYPDIDGDGYGSGESLELCGNPCADIPPDDCWWTENDNDPEPNCWNTDIEILMIDECDVCNGPGFTTIWYVDNDSDGLGSGIIDSTQINCGATLGGYVLNNYDNDDYCFDNTYDYIGECCDLSLLDACGICNGGNETPELLSINYPPNTFFIADNPYLILYKGSEKLDIIFSRSLESLGGIYLSSSISSGFNESYWDAQISDDDSIIDLDIFQFTSSDILELTIDWNNISFSDCDYSIDNTTVITLYTQILGDYDQNNYLDGADIQILLNYWNDNITTEQFDEDNYNIDLAPVSGEPPHFISSPDGVWNLDDLMAFIRMWNYENIDLSREKITHTADYGLQIELEIINNKLTMQFPVFNESMSRIWFQLSLTGNKTNFDVADFGQQFDISLQTNAGENVHIWDLANLGNGMNLQSLVLGELEAQSKEPQELEFQYQVISRDGMLSSGTMMVEYMPLPDDFELSQAYPNPFNPATTLQYALPVESDIVISVHDIQGRLVTYLENERKSAGYYEAVWNPSNHASGMYFIRMNVYGLDNKLQFNKLQKIMLVK